MATICKHCGGKIIFRRSVKRPNGSVFVAKRPIPIHLNAPCTKK